VPIGLPEKELLMGPDYPQILLNTLLNRSSDVEKKKRFWQWTSPTIGS
jgi:hypothetical protein